jgi:hypothetical protein
MESSQPDFFLQLANSLQQKGLSFDEIGMQLLQQGAPEHLLLEIIMQLKSLRLTKKKYRLYILRHWPGIACYRLYAYDLFISER